ncbi:type IV pilus modification protein PilV [Marinobacter sp. BGYM27]|nr:type IV pilus modification protein PilV [Marinobacter sp. BGYM27]MDG5500678.1 type IV pilus modification protein PilV [Marinobacter sp. BGYM27]
MNAHPFIRSNGDAQRGFTMIEVLVALLVLAIGLLGVAGVQLLSLQQTSNADLRSQATLVAQNMAERVRANGGSALDSADLTAFENEMSRQLGGGSSLSVNINNDIATIQVQWTERDPFAANNSSTQTLTMNARL